LYSKLYDHKEYFWNFKKYGGVGKTYGGAGRRRLHRVLT